MSEKSPRVQTRDEYAVSFYLSIHSFAAFFISPIPVFELGMGEFGEDGSQE